MDRERDLGRDLRSVIQEVGNALLREPNLFGERTLRSDELDCAANVIPEGFHAVLLPDFWLFSNGRHQMSCRDISTSKLVNVLSMIDIELFVRLRAEKKLSQNALAEAVGVSQQLIGEIERGGTRSTKAIYRIAHALGTTANLLDPEIPAVAGRWAAIEQELAELDEEEVVYLLERLANDIRFALRAKHSRKPEHNNPPPAAKTARETKRAIT